MATTDTRSIVRIIERNAELSGLDISDIPGVGIGRWSPMKAGTAVMDMDELAAVAAWVGLLPSILVAMAVAMAD